MKLTLIFRRELVCACTRIYLHISASIPTLAVFWEMILLTIQTSLSNILRRPLKGKPIFFLITWNFQNWIKWTAFLQGPFSFIYLRHWLHYHWSKHVFPQSKKILFVKAEFAVKPCPPLPLPVFHFHLNVSHYLYCIRKHCNILRFC